MDELGKVKRVVEKQAPVTEVLLVLDATTGQNGLSQARVFREVVDVTGIVLTKLDGSAKGGIVVAVQRELGRAGQAGRPRRGRRRPGAVRPRRRSSTRCSARPPEPDQAGRRPRMHALGEDLDQSLGVLGRRHRPVRDRADREEAAQPLDGAVDVDVGPHLAAGDRPLERRLREQFSRRSVEAR